MELDIIHNSNDCNYIFIYSWINNMCEKLLDKPIQLLKGKTIKKIIQASDCMGQTFIIELDDNLSINIDRNDDGDFFLSIYEDINPVPLFQTDRPW